MTRKTKMLLNTASSLAFQVVSIVCGFILPRILLSAFGSETNGLISSITQFLGFISLCECGVGAVVQSALYKPLADGEDTAISKIYISSEKFFRKIAYILIAYTVGLVVFYPQLTLETFDFAYTAALILIIAISTFAQYYFAMTYRLLLIADQMGFIYYAVQIVTLVLNTLCSVLMIQAGASIHLVKLLGSALFLLQPVVLSYVAKKRYRLQRDLVLTQEPLEQKWNGLSQHIAAVVLQNTDTVVLTLLSTLKNVSIYGVYNLVVHGVRTIVLSLTNGVQAMFGNMLAKGEMEELERNYDNSEWMLHTVVTLVFTLTGLLVMPFVQVYTAGIEDANYLVPLFAYLITMAQASYCIRLPYNIMVLAAGHYKQTQTSAIVEAVINVVLSVVLVAGFGLVGVAIGTLVAMLYRTCYLAWYLSKNILFRSLRHFVRHMAVDILSVVAVVLCVRILSVSLVLTQLTYFAWVVLAVKVGLITLTVVLLVNFLFYRGKVVGIFRGSLGILKRFGRKIQK